MWVYCVQTLLYHIFALMDYFFANFLSWQIWGVPPTGTDKCAGDAAADAVASVAQTDDPAGSSQEKGENECQ